jgi:hypothetical protein
VGDRSFSEATWMFLSVAEDYHRTLMDAQEWLEAEPTIGEGPVHHINLKVTNALDNYKYAARQALWLLRSKLKSDSEVRPQLIFRTEDEKARALTLLLRSEEYAHLARSFASFHNRLVNVFNHEDDSMEFSQPPEIRPYSMLEHFCADRCSTGGGATGQVPILIQILKQSLPDSKQKK